MADKAFQIELTQPYARGVDTYAQGKVLTPEQRWVEGTAEADDLEGALTAVRTMLTEDGCHADRIVIDIIGHRYADGELVPKMVLKEG